MNIEKTLAKLNKQIYALNAKISIIKNQQMKILKKASLYSKLNDKYDGKIKIIESWFGKEKFTLNHKLFKPNKISINKYEHSIFYYLKDDEFNCKIYMGSKPIFSGRHERQLDGKMAYVILIKDYTKCKFSHFKEKQIIECEKHIRNHMLTTNNTVIDKRSFNYEKFHGLLNFK